MHQAQWRLCANEPPRLVSTKSVHPSPRTRGKTVIGPSLHRRAGNFNAFEPFVSLPLRTKYEVGARVGFCRRFEDRLYGDFKARVHFFETGRYVVRARPKPQPLLCVLATATVCVAARVVGLQTLAFMDPSHLEGMRSLILLRRARFHPTSARTHVFVLFGATRRRDLGV